MQLVTLRINGTTQAGRVHDGEIVLLDAPDVGAVLAAGPVTGGSVAVAETGESVAAEGADLAPLIPNPSKIICVGLNYEDHIIETKSQRPEYPSYFAKYARALTGPRDNINMPKPDVSTMVDWEVELAVIIGRPIRHASPAEALSGVAGFAVLNDVSVRDWQKRTPQFLAGKTFEGATPLGPALVTADAVGDGLGLAMGCEVNGVVKQAGNTSEQVFGPAEVVSDLSTIMTLDPGDVIATGTPAGVGMARTPSEWLAPGDVVRTWVEGLGELVNTCVIA